MRTTVFNTLLKYHYHIGTYRVFFPKVYDTYFAGRLIQLEPDADLCTVA